VTRVATIFMWELRQGLANWFLRVFALACVAGGSALLAAAPGRDVLPMVLIQVILFFGSLFAMLVGWASGQQARREGAFLFAQPVTVSERLTGQLGGASTWCAALLLLFMTPAAVRAGMPATLLELGALSLGLMVVCVLGGLVLGLSVTPVSGLLAVLLAWAMAVAGWEVGLLLLSDAVWVQQTPAVFIALLLVNPAGAFRIAALVGLDAVPFDASELETGRWVFEHIGFVATGVFVAWVAALWAVGVGLVGRAEF